MKNGLLKGAMALSFLGAGVVAADTFAQPITAQAKVRVTGWTTNSMTSSSVHVSKGYMYSSQSLTKKVHNAANYTHTTFKRTLQATIKKSDGSKVVYQYISSGKVKGWIWHGYVKNGNAPKAAAKSVNSYRLAMNKYIAGTYIHNGKAIPKVTSFDKLADYLYSIGKPTNAKKYAATITALENIEKLFGSKMKKSVNYSHITGDFKDLKKMKYNNPQAQNLLIATAGNMGYVISEE